MELNLKDISVETISSFLNRIKHLHSNVEVDMSFEGKKVNFLFNFKEKYYVVSGGPFLTTAPREEWFNKIVTSTGPVSRNYIDIDALVGEIYTIMYVVAMPEII